MKKIIQQLLEVEGEAKRIVAEAEKQTRRAIADARRKAQDLLEQKRQLAAEEAQRLVHDQVDRATADKQARLDEASARHRATVHIPDERAAEAVETIFRAVTGQ